MKKTEKVLDKETKGLDGIRRNWMLVLGTKILSTWRAASTATWAYSSNHDIVKRIHSQSLDCDETFVSGNQTRWS